MDPINPNALNVSEALVSLHVPPRRKYRADFMAMELHLPDESRSYHLWNLYCPVCRYECSEIVRTVTCGPVDAFVQDVTYHIRCQCADCRFEGPRFQNTQDALQNWKLHAALTE